LRSPDDRPEHPVLRWLPNLITAIRIALIPVFLVVAESGRAALDTGATPAEARLGALAVFVAIGLSDLLDGFLARRYGLQSQSGAILDAAADKLAQVVVLAYLTLTPGPPFADLPLWLFLLVVGRDLLLGGSWVAFAALGRKVRVIHRSHGKMASSLLFSLLVWVLVDLPHAAVPALSAAVAVVIVASTVQYLREGWTRRPPA
jgi:cardiolipin synthase